HGAHMNTFVVSGLHVKSSRHIARKIRELGVRLNWSVELVLNNPQVRNEVVAAMSTEITLPTRALTVMDKVIADLAEEQIMVVLDNHISDAKWCCDPGDENGLWFNDRWSTIDYEHAWEIMAGRYLDQPYVIAADLRNEIRPDIKFSDGKFVSMKYPAWGTGSRMLTVPEFIFSLFESEQTKAQVLGETRSTLKNVFTKIFNTGNLKSVEFHDWKSESESVSRKVHLFVVIHKVNPNLIIIVQGVFDANSYQPTILSFLLNRFGKIPQFRKIMESSAMPKGFNSYRQIQNLTGIMRNPPQIPKDRLAFTAHIYPFFYEESRLEFDGQKPTFAVFVKELNAYWGDISRMSVGPLWVGEFGTHRE
ncbi:hypothetical protein HK096_009272, partial [Nowakowskiella sp. JEL0078]